MPRPAPGTFPIYFNNYIGLVKEDDLRQAFKNQQPLINGFFDAITEKQSTQAYEEGKWTLKELLQHVIDTERIFNYRALAFARKEAASLPGFDENAYAANSNSNGRGWKSLVSELKAVRKATEMLYESFNDEMLNNSGLANNNPMTVNAMGFTTIGHLYHHKNIIETRYLAAAEIKT